MYKFIPKVSWLVQLNNSIFTGAYRITRRHFVVWHWVAKNYNSYLTYLARFNACSICDWARYEVPAYRKYLKKNKSQVNYWQFDPTQYPETNKKDYIKAYSFADRCKFGFIPSNYTTIDESSGSTGAPYNWIRTMDELTDVHRISSNYLRTEIHEKNLITLNAFSMGAWATGLNMTLGLLPISIVKSIGPDMDKIIDTLNTFGSTKKSGYAYLLCGYPPFVKHLVERMQKENFPFEDYRLYAVVGGEGMTEAMRDYLGKYFLKVRSGYGATDIQLGVGGETDFTIWVRKQLLNNFSLRENLLGKGENRTPMVFHYNPMDHYIETNANNEIIITINSFKVLSPRLRYNLEDEGKVLEYEELLKILKASGYTQKQIQEVSKENPLKMPVVLIYGRKDGTISYMGANIYPQDVGQGIYSSQLANKIEGFKLSLEQRPNLDPEVTLHIELKEGILTKEANEGQEDLEEHIRNYLSSVNRDYEESLKEDPKSGKIKIDWCEFGAGVFAHKDPKSIKQKYLVG